MLLLLLLGLAVGAPDLTATGIGPDRIPRGDVDAPGAPTLVSTHARWLFRPGGEAAGRAVDGLAGAETVAVLSRFDDLWILEAPAANRAEVEAQWGPLGELRRDRGGTPALDQTTRLVGARPITWSGLALRGNFVGSVAILDSGCDTAHDDLGDPTLDNVDLPPGAAGDPSDWADAAAGGYPPDSQLRVVGWHDVTDDMPGARGPYDYHFHGTALAGVAFGSGEVDEAFTGVAPDGRFVVVKTYNFEGQWQTWVSDFLLGVEWVLTNASTYNIQAVLVGTVWEEDLDLTTAVEMLADAGIAVIAPAGNDPTAFLGYPARAERAIAVGATDETGQVTAYSSPSENYPLRLDLVAPGGSRLTLEGGVDACDNEPNDTYRGRTGTSLAAAHVAGAVSLVQQVMVESGTVWRRDRAQVQWLESLLTITAVETPGAEPGAPRPHVRSRLGADPLEGFGLLQIPAAVDVVRNVLWPGDVQTFVLNAPSADRAVWAARVPTTGRGRLRFEMFPPPEADFDLFAYRELPDGFLLRGLSMTSGLGAPEVVEIVDREPGWLVLVVKRTLGAGLGQIVTSREFLPGHRWPVTLSAQVAVPSAVHDLDGDGALEVITANNVAVDATGHTFYVHRADGTSFLPFPRTFFSALPGVLSTPAVVDLGAGPVMISGSSHGEILAINVQGLRAFSTQLLAGEPTTGVAVAGTGTGARLFVGTGDGVSVLDAGGAVVDSWALPGGVTRELAIGDLDGDQQDEVIAVEDGVALHALRQDGTALPGWPVALVASSVASAPVLVGDFGGTVRVAFIERTPAGDSLLHLREAAGQPAAGFPVTFDHVPGGQSEATADPIASRLVRGGPVRVAAPAWHTTAQGEVDVRIHLFDLDGTQTVAAVYPMGGPRLADSTFLVNRRQLASARVVEVGAGDGAEIWVNAQLAWSENFLGSTRRYGSSHPALAASRGGLDPRRAWQSRSGHLAFPTAGAVPITVADLDRDAYPEIIVARDNRLFLLTSPVPSEPGTTWGEDRGGGSRRACYGCEPDPVVATPPGPAAVGLHLRAAPNPFNPRTTLRLTASAVGRAEWSVYDARGRQVDGWTQVLAEPGPVAVTWEGTDRSGRPLASGVYFVVVRMGGDAAAASVSLVR